MTFEEIRALIDEIANETVAGANTKTRVATVLSEMLSKSQMGIMGNWDASGDEFPNGAIGSGVAGAIMKNNMFICSVAGNPEGVSVQPGAIFVALVDNPDLDDTDHWSILVTAY